MQTTIPLTKKKPEKQTLCFSNVVQVNYNTVESLELMVLNFRVLLYLWVAPPYPHEFASSTKTNLGRVIFIIETENRRIHEITSLRITIHGN